MKLRKGPFTHKDYHISPVTKDKWCKNLITSYEWVEYGKIKGYCVHGPGAYSSTLYKTIKSAQDHIDFLIKFQE